MKKNDKNRFSLINNFPLIIMVVAAVIIVLLVNVYLSFKPYDTIYQNGYMVLSNNMAYNLINNNSLNNDLNVGVVSVNNGDSIYKQIDSYYVGEEQKKEIDYGYPIYSSDGLTIHAINDEFTLVNRNFEMLDGYSGLSLNYGFVYNEGEEEPADDIDYLFMKLKNSIFINSQVINVQTEENEYNIPVNSPIYFNSKYINYYTFDGENFNYDRISDIEYESLIKIGDVGVTYEDLLLKMNIAKKIDIEEDKKNKLEENESNETETDTSNGIGNGAGTGVGDGSGNGTGTGTGNNDGTGNGGTSNDLYTEIFGEYIDPTVTIGSLVTKTYSLTLDVIIDDPSGVIISAPTFEVYTNTGKLYSRKKISASGQLKMISLSASTEYKIIGKYTYKDKFGLEITKNIYEKEFKTDGVDDLETIKISSQTGSRYSNKIEIKDFTVLNPGIETLNGVKKITIQTWTDDNLDEILSSNVSTVQLRKILKGEATTIQSYNKLKSNTVYNYKILFYDKNNNVFNLDGKNSGVIKTAKMAPTISSSYSYDYKNDSISFAITTNNSDNVYIDEYKYNFYKPNGEILSGNLKYENKETKTLTFNDLIYEKEYYLQITGTYDLEDGNGEVSIDKYLSPNPIQLRYPETIKANYRSNQLEVTDHSIKTNIYINGKPNVLSKNNGFVSIFLENNPNEPTIFYNKKNNPNGFFYEETSNGYVINNVLFDNLTSNTEYKIMISVGLDSDNKGEESEFKTSPVYVGKPITTKKKEPYVDVEKMKLYNGDFTFVYNIVDIDNVIGDKTVRIDIYDKDCKNNICKDFSKMKNVYGTTLDMSKKIIRANNFYSDNYTVTISTIDNGTREYIKFKESNDFVNYISLTKSNGLTLQMKKQIYEEIDEKTTSVFEIVYDSPKENFLDNMAFYNCRSNSCKKLAINLDTEDISNENGVNYAKIEILNYDSTETNRKLYAVAKNATLDDSYKLDELDELDVLYSIEYTTNKKIDEISDVATFLLLNEKNNDDYNVENYVAKGNYVVTRNLIFSGAESPGRTCHLNNLSGVLDFQGHTVTLNYSNNYEYKHFIKTIDENGVLKNIELELNFNFTSSYQAINGIIYINYGTIEDVIINMNQPNSIPMVYNGFVYANNSKKNSEGKINRFIIYLKTNIYTDGLATLGLYRNNSIVKNGYIATHPDSLSNGIKAVYVTKNLGIVAWENTKIIKNVYNLVDVESNNNNKKYFGTIAYRNYSGGIIENTLSVSKTTAINENRGPNIYINDSNAINNYYVNMNDDSNSYNYSKYPFNIPIKQHLLANTFFMDSLMNNSEKEDQFKINHLYYPTLNLSNFMKHKQKATPIDISSYDRTQLVLAISTANDIREKGLSEKEYKTSEIELHFIVSPSAVVDGIVVDGNYFEIKHEKTKLDPQTGMTILYVDLTLKGGGAKSSYTINKFYYHVGNSNLSKSPEIDVSVDLFRPVNDYNGLVEAINNNDNILITNNIELNSNDINNLPNIDNYTAKIYGVVNNAEDLDGVYIDFKNQNISRGYFISKFSGTLKNVQIKGLNIESNSSKIGFIKDIDNAKIENVDISDSKFSYVRNEGDIDYNTLYVGTLAATSNNFASILKTSSNNNNISVLDDNKVENRYIGGLVSWMAGTNLSNCYVYNVKMSEIYIDNAIGTHAIGGLIAYTSGSQISNVYTNGKIVSNYSNVGGIIGSNLDSYVENAYSYMDIFSTGIGIGGIAGIQTTINRNFYRNVMFIGNIEGSNNYSYLLATSLSEENSQVLYNAYLLNLDKENNLNNPGISSNVNVIENNEFEKFDKNDAFGILPFNNIKIPLPYLYETSFVDQEIKEISFKNLGQPIEMDYNSSCKEQGYNSGEKGLCYDVNGKLAGVANYAIVANCSSIIKESVGLNINYDTCKIEPQKNYKDYYDVKLSVNGEFEKIYLPFYRNVNDKNTWKEISDKYNENIYISANINFVGIEDSEKTEITKKRINNLVSIDTNKIYYYDNNDSTATKLILEAPLIDSLTGTMESISFENFEIRNKSGDVGTGLILLNNGRLTNCKNCTSKNTVNGDQIMFQNITVEGNNNVGIIAFNSGSVDYIDIANVNVSGVKNVGGLIAYDNTTDLNTHVNQVFAEDITVNGVYRIGGIQGYSYYLLENITINNFKINFNSARFNELLEGESLKTYEKGRIGGIVGEGECPNGCKATNGDLVVAGDYVGGILGRLGSKQWTIAKAESRDITIRNADGYEANYVGGIVGYHDGVSQCYVDGLSLQGKDGNSGYFNGKYIGGAVGNIARYLNNCYVKNSNISGDKFVGGAAGFTTYDSDLNSNVVANTIITSNGEGAGGIIGEFLSDNARIEAPVISSNLVYNITLKGKSRVGGLIGYFMNDVTIYQGTTFKNNIVANLNLSRSVESQGNNDGFGGIIGELYKEPDYEKKMFEKSVYSVGSGISSYNSIGKVINDKKGNSLSTSGYNKFIAELVEKDFKKVANLTEIEDVFDPNGKSTSQSKYFDWEEKRYYLTENSDNTIVYIEGEDGKKYFPMPKIKSWKNSNVIIPIYNGSIVEGTEEIRADELVIDPEFIEVSVPSSVSYATRSLMTARRFSTYSSQLSTKEALDLEVYTVDVDKVNIDFSGIDEDSKFYYEIGNYSSPTIPVVNRTFTISYDFKQPIKLTLDSGGKIKTKTINPNDLIRTISYVDDKVYYIDNGILYNEDKVITGNFINLYDNKVLTTSGMIYNLSTKEEIASNVDYKLQYNAKPLYSFEYNGNIIETYYNYSIYNSIIKDYQILLKNGLINVIDNTLDNKKDSYIIDLYNNNEVQIVLKNDGILYSLKGNIEYPSDFDNKKIIDLYTNFDSTNNIAVIKYESGEVYAFDYLNGKKIFTNFSTENLGFIDYISSKIKNDVNNSIVSLVPMEEYTEINLLKGKISDISIDEANNKINNNNSSVPETKSDYISVYNDVTQKYDIYKTENILNSIELDPETEKINRDYELVQFYETLNVKEKRKSLSGIVIFTLSIIAILFALYKLIRRRKARV